MKLRYKLWMAMTALILFMGGTFFAISHGYIGQLFRQYAKAAEAASAEQLARNIAAYYEQNGWYAVDQYIVYYLKENPEYTAGFNSLLLKDTQGHILVSVGKGGAAPRGQSDTSTVTIRVHGQEIGVLTVSNRILDGSPVEQNILSSMTAATVWGTILTSMVALLVGVWLMRLMTTPLQSLLVAMKRLQHGDLSVRVDVSSNDEFGEVAKTFNEMTDRLSRTEEARRHLVADVAHELRTP
ncbi:hypothetical protein GCM10025857_02040 [Alicyclobacillus contaminans]|nr:hypothetical protein GCM10025857_02040 [Alicyclobacillus contaminans]